MTSAVLAGRNEVHHHHHWGDARVPRMPKPSNPNHRRHRPSPNPNHTIPPPPPRPAPPAAAAPEPSPSGHVIIRPSSLSRREARELRARLTGELGRVRAFLSNIDAWEDQQQRPRDAEPPPQMREAMLNRCAQILTKIRKQRNCVWFNKPVDVEKFKLHDYHAVIRSPMDLGTVKANLAAGRYPSHEAFASDVRLTFSNALRYNPVGHEVHRSAGNLLANFEGLYQEAVSLFEQECEQLESTMRLDFSPPRQPLVHVPVQATPAPRLLQEPPRMMGVGKRPKPKAREPNKREMSEEEKQKLRVEIESLPEEEMVNVLQIVQKRSTDPALRGDVVELDFDEMDVETLWELDRFVVNCKKVLKKSRQTAVTNGDAVMAPVIPIEDDMVTVNVDSPTVVDIGESETDVPHKWSSEAEMMDEYVDIGDEMPAANYQSVEIEKVAQVASSSSGSESGSSSSSDSGSRSSGDVDSDGDDARSRD